VSAENAEKKMPLIQSCLFVLIWGVGSVLADAGLPMPFYKEVFTNTSIWDFLFGFYHRILLPILFATVVIEYFVVYLMLRRPSKAKIQLFLYIILINLITNPAAQLAMLFIGDPDLTGSSGMSLIVVCIIELVVVAIEFGLMMWIFGRMHRRGLLEKPVATDFILIIAVVTNLASFGLVFIGFMLIIMFSGK
jgi:hypothetical protein